MLAETLLTILLSLPPHVTDRDLSEAERTAMLTPIAGAVAVAVSERPGGFDRVTLASAVLAIGWMESRFAEYVVRGKCGSGPVGARCDMDSQGRPRARGVFQLWRVACPAAYAHPAGSHESLQVEARCAARLVAGAYYRCRGRHPAGNWSGAFSGYRGASCSWSGAVKRTRSMNRFRSKIRRMLAARPSS